MQFVIPLAAAVTLSWREARFTGIKRLLSRIFDFILIPRGWYVPIICFWPAAMAVVYLLLASTGASLPAEPFIPLSVVPVFLVLFFVSAVCEQTGWTAYAHDPLETRRGALPAALIVGLVWGVWHIVPMLQIPRPPTWVFWQCLGMIPFRVLIVWIYNNTRKSVFATILFQAVSNVSQFSFPNYGSHYDPFFTFVILAAAAITVAVVWGPRTLANNRFTPRNKTEPRRDRPR